jgi:hypothetical protein
MNGNNTRRYDMLKRVCDFGAGHADVFPASSLGGKMFARVGTAVAALDEHAAARVATDGAVRDGARAKSTARETLRDALRAISSTAQAVAIDIPGLDEKFRLRNIRIDQALLNAGRAIGQAASAYAGAFIAHGLPTTFRKDLDAAIGGFETAIRDDAAARDAHAAARDAFDGAMEDALTAIRRLDAIVANRLRGDRNAIAAWERARYVDRPSRARNGAAEPAKAVPAAAATPPPQPSSTAPSVGAGSSTTV